MDDPEAELPPYAEIVLRLLNAGASPNCRLPDDLLGDQKLGNAVTVVTDAAQEDRLASGCVVRLVEKLVRKGASPDGRGRTGISPLQIAAAYYPGYPEFLRCLLDMGADPNYGAEIQPRFNTGWLGSTALQTAIASKGPEAMRYLMLRGANPGPGPDGTPSPLWLAVNARVLEPVLTLLNQGVNPNVVETARYPDGSYFESALSNAVWNRILQSERDIPILQHLLESGADPNLQDRNGKTTLWFALGAPSDYTASVVELLLKHGADPNGRAEEGRLTPLIGIIELQPPNPWIPLKTLSITSQQRVKIVEKLIQAGADVNQCVERDDTSLSPLEAALTTPYPGNVQLTHAELDDRLCHAGAALDYFDLEHFFNERNAEVGSSDDKAIVLRNLIVPQYVWADKLIPTLLRAGARVSQELLDKTREILKRRDPDLFP